MTKDFENISYAKIIEYLNEISTKINSLHECSTKDFSQLSASFKDYFKKSNELSGKANEIINKIHLEDQSNSFKKLDQLYKELFKTQKTISSDISNVNEFMEKSNSAYNKLYYKIKNYEQNLLALKLIFTNVKISLSEDRDKELLNIEKEIYSSSKNVIEQLSSIISEFEIFEGDYKSNSSLLEKNKKFINKNLNTIVDQLYSAIIFYSDKQEESIEILPKISAKTKICSKDLEEIIKYLQFHDIIRQKMEHIHDAQQKLIDEINTADEKDIAEKEKAEILQMISNIANLQSAQLLRANKEYQAAINHIVNKLQNISLVGTEIYDLCKNFANYDESNKDTIYKEFGDRLSNVSEYFMQVNDKMNEVHLIVDNYSKRSKKINDTLELAFGYTTKNESYIKDYIKSNNKSNDSLKLNAKLEEHLEILRNNKKEITEIFNNFIEHGKVLNIDSVKVNYNSNTELLSNISTLIKLFEQKQSEIDGLLFNLNNLSLQLSGGIGESIKKVGYYDCFDSTVSEIILLLNNIRFSTELKVEDEAELERLKEHYTVESEHMVHELLLQSEAIDNLDEEEDEEENEVEFF